MALRVTLACLLSLLVLSPAGAASLDEAGKMFLAGDLDGARSALHEVLAGEPAAETTAPALRLLGQIEVDAHNWQAALDAWGRLTNEFAMSAEAAEVSAAIRPLQALAECDCDSAASRPTEMTPVAQTPTQTPAPAPAQAPARAPAAVPTPAPAPAPQAAAVPPPAPAPALEPVPGKVLVGAWGAEYDAAEEATAAIVDFLNESGVDAALSSTEVPAIRGEEVVLSYLLEEARSRGASSVMLISTRFGYRDYIRFRVFNPQGLELWKDGVRGGTELKPKKQRGKVAWGLVDRAKERLAKRHIGTPNLPTS